MPSHKGQHSSENIKREIYAIMRELKDPRISEGFISIVKIDMFKDMSGCKVYVSAMEGLERAKKAVKGLQSASGYIRKEIGSRLRLKYVPTIEFQATDSVEYGVNILKKINSIKAEDKEKTLAQTAEILREMDNIIILTHHYPDGDTLGSAYGLCRALQKLGKKAKVLHSKTIAKKYRFLEEYEEKQEFEPQNVVSVDIADTELLDEEFKEYSNKIDLCIDHHISNKRYAKALLLESDSASTAEIIYKVVCELGVEVDKEIANCIYTGLSTDTGCFKYSNVTPQTHKIAAQLMEHGAEVSKLNKIFFDTKLKEMVELEKMIYEDIRYYFQYRCALVCVTLDMMKKAGVDESELEGIASIPRSIEGIQIGLTIREKADGFHKISVRTVEGLDASKVCKVYGGGGHACTGGCTIKGRLETVKDEILMTVREVYGW